MEISTLLLADSTRVRDGLLFVLGGGITHVRSERFPMLPQIDLGLILDIAPGEWPGHMTINIDIERDHHPGVTEKVAGLAARYVGVLDDPERGALVPLAFSLTSLSIPEPGSYFVNVQLAGLAPRRIPLTVETLEQL